MGRGKMMSKTKKIVVRKRVVQILDVLLLVTNKYSKNQSLVIWMILVGKTILKTHMIVSQPGLINHFKKIKIFQGMRIIWRME